MAAGQIRDILAQLDRVAVQVVQKVALDVVANLVRAPNEGGTPVDTGWARSNWIINIGGPLPGPVGSKVSVPPVNPAGSGILGYRLLQGAVWISTMVPYIGLLNEGSSRQAPAGFVQRAIEKAISYDLAQLRVVSP